MIYDYISTENDVNNERYIQGAELTECYNMPILMPVNISPVETVSFSKSFKLMGDLSNVNLNFYEDDYKFQQVWSNPQRYMEHFSKFSSVCMPDFTVSMFSPKVVNMWNVYRNRSLAYFFSRFGINVIPNVNILPAEYQDWIYDGIPKHSTLCCSTNGRTGSIELRAEFCGQFMEMERRLKPNRVIIYGREIRELRSDCEIVYLQTDNMKINKKRNEIARNKDLFSLHIKNSPYIHDNYYICTNKRGRHHGNRSQAQNS